MENEFAKHELDYLRRYEAAGFTDQYRMVEDKMENLTTKAIYTPQDVTIMKEHRYEGMSNPSDMSLLYVIETSDGSQGTVLASYGANGNGSFHQFMANVPKENIKEDFMLPPDAE